MNIWKLRAEPHNEPHINDFLAKNIIAIGWSKSGNLSGKSKKEIVEIISGVCDTQDNEKAAVRVVNNFVNDMAIGDIVMVLNTGHDDIHFAEIISGYEFRGEFAVAGYVHCRQIKWLKHITKWELTDEERLKLLTVGTLNKIHKCTAKIEKILNN